MNPSCQVKHCRFKYMHVTLGHLCGICKNYGHGEMECNNNNYKNLLLKYHSDNLSENDKCKFGGCNTCYHHKTESHHCNYCNERFHSPNTCPKLLNIIDIMCPLCKTKNILSLTKDKIFGLEDKCKVCMDNTIELLLPMCKHGCLCIKCAKIMNNSNTIENIENINSLINRNYNIDYIQSLMKETPSYIMIREDFDNIIYIRRLNNNCETEVLLFHIDQINDNRQNNFINGYLQISILNKSECIRIDSE